MINLNSVYLLLLRLLFLISMHRLLTMMCHCTLRCKNDQPLLSHLLLQVLRSVSLPLLVLSLLLLMHLLLTKTCRYILLYMLYPQPLLLQVLHSVLLLLLIDILLLSNYLPLTKLPVNIHNKTP